MPTLAEVVARNVQALRRERGLRQSDLAKLAGISEIYVASIEQGWKVPALGTLEGLAKGLGLDPGELAEPELARRPLQ